MITCRELIELLFEFDSGGLPEGERESVELHLLGCAPCAAYVESYRITVRMTRQLTPLPIPPHLRQRLEAILYDAGMRRTERPGDEHPLGQEL